MRYRVFPSLTDYLVSDSASDYKGFLIDIDGTLKIGSRPITTASDAVSYLNNSQYPYVLATNDSSNSPATKHESLLRMGIPVQRDRIYSCAEAISQLVSKYRLQGEKVFVLGKLSTPCCAENAGLITERDPKLAYKCSGVIVSEFGYHCESGINAAVNLFHGKPTSFLISPNPD